MNKLIKYTPSIVTIIFAILTLLLVNNNDLLRSLEVLSFKNFVAVNVVLMILNSSVIYYNFPSIPIMICVACLLVNILSYILVFKSKNNNRREFRYIIHVTSTLLIMASAYFLIRGLF